MRLFFSLLLIIAYTVLKSQSTIETIPNQKLINNSYVSNPDAILSAGTIAEIDLLLNGLEQKTSVQVAVVVVNSIGQEDIFDFAQKLFQTWGIGSKTNNNGLLLLLVKDQRTLRFHTGYGLEGTLPDVVCKRIQRDYMLPEFKNENYDAGIVNGLKQVDRILTDPVYAEELKKSETKRESGWIAFVIFLSAFCAPVLLVVYIIKASGKTFKDSKSPRHTDYPEVRLTRKEWLVDYVGLPVLIVIVFSVAPFSNPSLACFLTLYFYFLVCVFRRIWRAKKVTKRLLENKHYHQLVAFVKKSQGYWFFTGLLFPLPFFFYFFYHLSLKRKYRNYPRTCHLCNGKMHKLTERKEDQFLSTSQQLEETLRSVDYDVWQCEACKATEQWNYQNRNSKYAECPSCKIRAYYVKSSRTITSATYSSSGVGENSHSCKSCGISKKSTYSIAQLVQSTSSGSSSGGSSSGGGGSWGGGSSGGGGASSSW